VTFGTDGNLYVADTFFGTSSILRYNGKNGAFIDVFATGGGIQQPHRLTFSPDKNLFVGNATTSDVLRYHGDTGLPYPAPGNSGAIFVPGIPGPFNTRVAFGPDGDLFVLSGATPDVLRYNGKTGVFIGTFVPNGNTGGDMVFGPNRNLYILNYFNGSVLRYNGMSGAFIDTFVSPIGNLTGPSMTFSPSLEIINDLVTFVPISTTYQYSANPTGPLFTDDFNDGNDNGWTQLNRSWHVIDGRYHLDGCYGCNGVLRTAGRDGFTYTHVDDPTWTDYTFEFTFDTTNAPSAYNPDWWFTAGENEAQVFLRARPTAWSCRCADAIPGQFLFTAWGAVRTAKVRQR
jgi:hypothetical protein